MTSAEREESSSAAVSLSRRNFLRTATGIGLGGGLLNITSAPALAIPGARKAVVVTFGGGARDDETFMPDGQENIPHLLDELIPRATFFSQVINRGILGHYVATASLATESKKDSDGSQLAWENQRRRRRQWPRREGCIRAR